MSDLIKVVLLSALIVVVVVFGPIVTIWSLNTLFPALAIPTNMATWFATLWLGSFLTYKGMK